MDQELRNQFASMRKALLEQGYLDEQFVELEALQDDSNPHFAEDILTMFFEDAAKFIDEIETSMEEKTLNFETLEKQMHQFKGGSASAGAAKILEESILFRDFCKQGDDQGCKASFERLKKECATLKEKLDIYFQLARQIGGYAAGETASVGEGGGSNSLNSKGKSV